MEDRGSSSPSLQGKVAIHSPNTGIVDWRQVAMFYGKDFQEMGGQVYTNFEVGPSERISCVCARA